MALQKLDQRVLDYLAEGVSGDIGITQGIIDDGFTDGARDIFAKMPKELWEHFATLSDEQTSDGYASEIPVKVLREDGNAGGTFIVCRKISIMSSYDYENIASNADPVYYHEAGKVYVLPTPGTDPDAYKVLEVVFADVDASIKDSLSSVTGMTFPSQLDTVAILYVVIKCKNIQIEKMRRNSQDELEAITTSGYLSNFESALPTFVPPSEPSGTLSYTSAGSAPSSTVTVGSNLPTYDGPTTVVIDVSAINDKLSTDFEDTQMAMAEINKARSTVEEFAQNVNRAVGEFNGNVNKYLADLREKVDELRLGIDSYDAKAKDNFNTFQQGVQQYQSDIAKYQAQVASEAQRVQVDLTKARSYLEEAGVRLQTMAKFDNQANAVIQEVTALQNQYDKGINGYIRKFIPTPIED